MPRRELNNHNTAKKNGYFLGHSSSEATKSITDNLITLSLRRSPTREVTTPFILRAGRPRQNIRLFLQKCKGGRSIFYDPARM
jgi:hypothetical protein